MSRITWKNISHTLFRTLCNRQQNKCYPQRCKNVSTNAVNCNTLKLNLTEVKKNLLMLLWASKFAMAEIKCSFEMGNLTNLGVTFVLPAMVQKLKNPVFNVFFFESHCVSKDMKNVVIAHFMRNAIEKTWKPFQPFYANLVQSVAKNVKNTVLSHFFGTLLMKRHVIRIYTWNMFKPQILRSKAEKLELLGFQYMHPAWWLETCNEAPGLKWRHSIDKLHLISIYTFSCLNTSCVWMQLNQKTMSDIPLKSYRIINKSN